MGATESWAVDFPNHIVDGDLVVPPGKFFMMGDHRHDSLDSRYWGFVPRRTFVGRPLFNYWSFTDSRPPVRRDRNRRQGGVAGTCGDALLYRNALEPDPEADALKDAKRAHEWLRRDRPVSNRAFTG